MQSILRFLFLMGMVLVTVWFWRPSHGRSSGLPPKVSGNSLTEVERSLGSLHQAPSADPWSKDLFQEQLEDAFRRQDPCAVLSLVREKAPISPSERWAAGTEILLKQAGGDNLLEELLAADSPLYGSPNENSKWPETRFFNALLYSNQFEDSGDHNSHRDNEKAVAILRELAQEDADNGAYNFFLAQALRQIGEKKQDVDNAYIFAGKAPRFDTFYQKVYDRLLSLSYKNLATFTWAYVFLHEAPVPSISTGVRNLRNWAADSDTGKWIGGMIAKRLIDTGAKYKEQSPGYLYSHLEYMQGFGLRYAIEGRAEKSWEDFNARMKEAKDFIAEAPPAVGGAASELYMDYFAGRESECRWSAWQALFEAYKAKKEK